MGKSVESRNIGGKRDNLLFVNAWGDICDFFINFFVDCLIKGMIFPKIR